MMVDEDVGSALAKVSNHGRARPIPAPRRNFLRSSDDRFMGFVDGAVLGVMNF